MLLNISPRKGVNLKRFPEEVSFVVVVLFVCVFVLDEGEGRQRKMARYWRIR